MPIMLRVDSEVASTRSEMAFLDDPDSVRSAHYWFDQFVKAWERNGEERFRYRVQLLHTDPEGTVIAYRAFNVENPEEALF